VRCGFASHLPSVCARTHNAGNATRRHFMLAIGLELVQIDPSEASTPQSGYTALAEAARRYLQEFERLAGAGDVPCNAAVITRVRGTGPGASFESLLASLLNGMNLDWQCPFEGSDHVSGAAIRGARVLHDPARHDGFLLLRFEAGILTLMHGR
jgi:hypothetical protein